MANDQSGRERLAQWIKRSKLNQIETARLIGIHETQLSQILAGNRRPGLDNAVKIEAVTGIPVEAWVSITLGSDADAAVDSAAEPQISKT